jgi:hypothetical protein
VFLIAVGDLCVAASLAQLPVEVHTRHGLQVAGVPGMPNRGRGHQQANDTGYAKTLLINDQLLELEDVTACTVRLPGSGSSGTR